MASSKIAIRWRGSSMVEQWTHKPLDVGSNPTLATIFFNDRVENKFPAVNKIPNFKMAIPKNRHFLF